MAMGQIEKQFGKGAVMRMGENLNMQIEAIPTGALSLDIALGIGGLPRGRIVEIFGPESSGKSTLAMHVVAEAQRNGGICAYVDAEHAMDPVYARAIGVNVDDLLISQPDTGEQALEIADMLIRSGALDVIVIDSVAALTPRAEIEGDMGDSHVGLQARLMSQALRKLTATLSKSSTIAIFINQLREKIGVMYGCLSYGTRVTLADGTREKIGKIVNQRMPVEVLSYDSEVGAVVPKKVVNWFDNGRTEQFLQLTVARPGGNGKAQLGCTTNHRIRTPAGWREAGELQVGDRVLQAVPHYLTDFQWQVILGGLLGDSALSTTRSGHGARYRFGHGAKQLAYGDWKATLFANLGRSRWVRADGAVFYDMQPLPELAELRQAVYIGGKKVLSEDYLKRLTPLSLAIWYMDDGHYSQRAKGLQDRTWDGSGRIEVCVEALEATSRRRLVDYLADTWGIHPRLHLSGTTQKPVLTFPKEEAAKFHALVAPFIHPSMDYKLPAHFRGRFAVEPAFAPIRHELMPLPIVKIAPKPKTRSMHRFDIEVEGSHNYLADGVVVHNSPETTPGGRALKFYSSVRLDIRRVESIKSGAEVIGNRTRVKVVKNKCVAAGTRVFDPATGETHLIEDIVERGAGQAVVAADKAGNLHSRSIVQRFNRGEAKVIGLGLREGTTLWVTPDHRVLTDTGWREAGELSVGDRLARPRRFGRFGTGEPVTPDQARMLGYLIGDGYVGAKTPIAFINTQESLQQDATSIAATLGCKVTRRGRQGIETAFSHRPGEKNELLALCRWAGIVGHLAPTKCVSSAFFDDGVSEAVVGNLLFGIFESDGYVSREQTGGLRVGFTTTSEQLAQQLHWLLLRWGIGSSVRRYDPTTKRPSTVGGRKIQSKLPVWEVRVSGIDNVQRFAEALPMWGPHGQVLTAELADPSRRKHRGSQRGYLPSNQIEPVLAYLRGLGVTPQLAASLIGERAGDPESGLRQVLGHRRLRRDRLERLADVLDSAFLRELLDEEVWYDRITVMHPAEWRDIYDIEVDEHHTFVANDVVVSNCSPPFRQAEFDIMYGHGISREGSLLDVAVDLGIVKKSGAWYTYEGEQLGQGRENAKAFIAENLEVMIEISEKVRQQVGLGEGGGSDIPLGADPSDDEPITLDD
jgi:recombination protein RecA